jgi:hypothetical protein
MRSFHGEAIQGNAVRAEEPGRFCPQLSDLFEVRTLGVLGPDTVGQCTCTSGLAYMDSVSPHMGFILAMRPSRLDEIPGETVRNARAAFPHSSLPMRIRDALGPIFEDGQFARLFARCGRPALAPWRLALVSVLQFAEGLSDRQAADALRAWID